MTSSVDHFARNLRHLRQARQAQEDGWSQEGLADRAGFHRNYIGMLERGERSPTLETLDQLAEVLDVSPWELLKPRSEEGSPR